MATLSIYVEEAHPADGWNMYTDICFMQPKTIAARVSLAKKYGTVLPIVSLPCEQVEEGG